jgi:Putative zinc-finger
MTTAACAESPALSELVDYAIGELPDDRQAAFEEHVFACESCSRRLESVFALGRAIAESVTQSATPVAVSGSTVAALGARGRRIREYRIAAGDTVACTIAPEDDWVAVQLEGIPDGVDAVRMDVQVLDRSLSVSAARQMDDLPVDAASRAAIFIVPGPVVRAYPRSQWVMTLHARQGDDPVVIGPFTMEHTPWAEL